MDEILGYADPPGYSEKLGVGIYPAFSSIRRQGTLNPRARQARQYSRFMRDKKKKGIKKILFRSLMKSDREDTQRQSLASIHMCSHIRVGTHTNQIQMV